MQARQIKAREISLHTACLVQRGHRCTYVCCSYTHCQHCGEPHLLHLGDVGGLVLRLDELGLHAPHLCILHGLVTSRAILQQVDTCVFQRGFNIKVSHAITNQPFGTSQNAELTQVVSSTRWTG